VTLQAAITSTLVNVWGNPNKYNGEGINMSLEEMLPDMLQLDFIAAIRDIFNLRFFMDKQKGNIYIEPWAQLLTEEIIDISEFIDFEDKPAETISQYYNKEIDLIWKDDTDDQAFVEYLKINTEGPGKKAIIMDSQFVISGVDSREHPFSSIIMGPNQSLGIYTVDVPRIWNIVPVSPFIMFDRKIGFNTRIVQWDGLTSGFSWNYQGTTKTQYPKIETIDWQDIYSNYWQKLFHYIDKGKLYTLKMKIKPGFLSQFLTVVNDSTKEGFRVTYQIAFENGVNNFFMQKITSDGNGLAEVELILKV
jgi:hypothetical protein